MIKRVIILTSILFISYSLFVISIAPKWWHASQHQWQDNVIKAQNFVYNNTDSFSNILVGSSLSCLLVMDSLPKTYNLAFGGQSIFDGLNILNHTSRIPMNIFIEMNFPLRLQNENFTSSISSPLSYYPKKVFSSLRAEKQPLGILGVQINQRITEPLLERIKSFFYSNALPEGAEKEKRNEMFKKLLQLQIDSYLKVPDKQLMKECFDNLKKNINELEDRGAKIVFYEMPVNSQLNHLIAANIIREAFYTNFSKLKYTYISFPESIEYNTSDGLHLNEDEVLKYTIFLKSNLPN